MEKSPQVSSSKNIESPQSGKVKQLFGHCFEISRLEEGDRIPVGGESILSDEVNIKVTGDFANLEPFLIEAHELASQYNLPKLKDWLELQNVEISGKLFATLFAFTKKFEEKYPDSPGRTETRRKMYREKDGEIKLSDIFAANTAECAEIAALAQAYLQQVGISSTYFSGDVLWNRDVEFSAEHSFLIVRDGDKAYIYDPTNPTTTNVGKFPSIYTTTANFEEEMRKGERRFVTAYNLLSKSPAFYGVNNGANIIAEKHII